MVALAILVPFSGILYLVWQIKTRDLRSWQHYACATSLITSLLLLVAGGRIESFGLAGNTVKLVDQKLEQIEALTEQNKRMAQKTVKLVTQAISGVSVVEGYDNAALNNAASDLLKAAGFSSAEIQRFLTKRPRPTLHESYTQLAQTIR
jgi:hypothetical protein